MKFGNILKKLRQDNNLTQEELAKKIDTSRSNIANYENNKNMPSIDVLDKLSKLFNVSTDYLLGKSDIRNPEQQIKDEFSFAYHKETEGLSDEEIREAIEFYKRIKYGKNEEKK